MKRYALLAIVLLFLPLTASAAISFVQGTGNWTNSGNAVSSTFASSNTAGNLIVVNTYWATLGATSSVSDSTGNTYVSAVGPTPGPDGLGNHSLQIFYAKNIVGGVNTVTVTLSTTTTELGIIIHEYAGAHTTSPFDVGSAGTSTDATSFTSGSATTTASSELIFGANVQTGNQTSTPGLGFTIRVEPVLGFSSEDRTVTSTGGYAATFTVASSAAYIAQMATFKAGPITWTGGGANSNWSTGGNWSGGVMPGATDDVIFSASSTVSSTWNAAGPPQIKSLTVSSTYTGILTIATSVVRVSTDWTFSAASSSFSAGTSTLLFNASSVNHTFTPGAATYYNIDNEDASSTLTVFGTSTVANNLVIGANISSSIASGTIAVAGNVIVSSTNFAANASSTNTALILLNSTGTQTISSNGGYLPSVTINKASGLALATTSVFISKGLTVQGGELRIGSATAATTFEVGSTTAVSSGGAWTNVAGVSSTVKLGGSVTNNGVIAFNGGRACGGSDPTIFIRSTATGTQRQWSGGGTFVMRYVSVRDQASTVPVTVWNGVNAGNNGSNWTFTSVPPITLIQTTSTFSGNVTNVGSTLSFVPKPTDFIVVAVAARKQDISSVADNKGNTYTLAASSTVGDVRLSVFYAKNISSTMPFTITSTAAGPTNPLTMAVFNYSGGATSSTFDIVTKNATQTATTSLTSGSVTAATTDELYFGAAALIASTTASAGSGWTARVTQTDNTAYQSLYTEDMNSVATTTSAATWTAATGTGYAAIEALFKPPILAYPATGTLDSVTYDTAVASGAQLNSVRWSGTQLAGTSVGFQFAVSNSSSGPWTFIGSDGTSGTYYSPNVNVTMPLSYSSFNNFRYFRYRITLFSNNTRTLRPTVTGVSVNWSP